MEILKYIEEKRQSGVSESQKILENLSLDLGIRVKEYPREGLYVLNYSQIESPKMNPIVRECRSLVLNKRLEVVSRSFDRFFNLGEGDCEVNFGSGRSFALEKADGSLIGLYYVPSLDQWHFRTRGTAFAESTMPSGRTYQEAILETIGRDFDEFQADARIIPQNTTYIFEFVSPENRVVTRYEKPELILLAVREISGRYPAVFNNLEFMVPAFTEELGWKNVRECRKFSVNSVEDVEKLVQELTDLQEGFVVLDTFTDKRVKVKSPAYLKCHAIRGEGLTPRRIAELVAINEQDEFLAVFPEFQQFFDPYILAKETLLQKVQETFVKFNGLETQKDFAIAIKDFEFSAMLFTMRKLQCSIEHAWSVSRETYRVELLHGEVECQSQD